MHKEKLLKSKRIYKGSLLGLRKDYVRLSNKKEAAREICEHPGAVAIVPILGNKIVLVRQYRRPADQILLEIPAGLIKKGESKAAAAKRELREETGFLAGKLKKMFSAYTSPGYSTEVIHYYIAQNLKKSVQNTEEDEIIKVELVPASSCLKLIKYGKIKDNKTIVGIIMGREYAKLYR